ncbi:2Fe-2S iron-sulfur cluster-binding protein [Pantoea trifolii]|uniref:Pyridoxamine 5'-phosphate oxidase family protein n=1 Tax=Pantoea trifolii TaxID=2968030 RepID=A0ABT1VN67_9GAMM|nr:MULTISPECIES: pyridoxamine 5'-phosphate oxidase family protein [unclassified Pantoea]MCQ8228973.1 pyridoxamine 5'-phosphate oxidase family protein [Pantoea sp. MMK2]MCQ8237147.1 pyridoxamine 5'-phosphate oxidase family protein [Pantoea sp. MMK3]
MSKKLSVWHQGEIALQQQAGVAERMADVGQRVIRDHMPDQHRDFYAQLPFIVAGSVDAHGDAWATLLEGQPGFIFSPNASTLDIEARPHQGDPAAAGMQDGAPVGLLGIELHTRRRNRMNGVLQTIGGGFRVQVEQSFGNCPRYIQLRDFHYARDPAEPYRGEVETLSALDDAAHATIAAADTFYVATYAERQVDASHRGGKAGFVRVSEDGLMTIPDFNGNLFFNTLGNIHQNGKAGLLFVDYASGDTLQLSGDAEVILDSPEIAAFQGAERLWTFRPRRIVRRRAALALRWFTPPDGIAPSSLMTGDWQAADQRLRAVELAARWRPFKVMKVVDESATIRSFHLLPDDGAGLLPHLAGQHLPIRVQLPGSEKPLMRAYTLSVAPSDGFYRISVKRDGVVSCYLHDHLHTGDTLEARAPAGDFTLDASEPRPAVLLAAGVGITPMLAMLRHLIYEGVRKQRLRPTFLFQSARSKAERPFVRELDQLLAAAHGAVKLVRVLSQTADAEADIDYDFAGRIDMALLSQVLPFNDYDFYLCGPPQFTQALYDGLRTFNIADDRIHAEAFGPSSLQRSRDVVAEENPLLPVATQSVPVKFMDSLKEARWTPDAGSLLELAEARGLSPTYSCRAGHCGSCKTKLLQGAVTYPTPPSAQVADDEVLICCARPAQQEGEVQVIQLAL